MTEDRHFHPSRDDIEWAEGFKALNSLLKLCKSSEKAALLLSTCRNAYLTVNALFAELQVVLGGASDPSALRGASELILRGAESKRIWERVGRALQVLHEFELKRAVWTNREGIWKDIESASSRLEQADRLAKDRAAIFLGAPKINDRGDGWWHELLAIDLRSQPHLGQYFELLDQVFNILHCSAELGRCVASDLDSDPQASLNLAAGGVDRDEPQVLNRVLELTKDLATSCDWVTVETSDTLVIHLTGAYRRPRSSSGIDRITFPIVVVEDETFRSIAPSLGTLMREALYVAHARLNEKFKPNVAKPPMPEPFLIDLPQPEPTFQNGQVRAIEVERMRCAANSRPTDVVRVAIANLAVPYAEVNKKNLRLSKDIADDVTREVRRALVLAESNKCDVIVFPEYSVPSSMGAELLSAANQKNIVIIAGLDGKYRDEKLCDEALIAIPGEKIPHFQRKQEPSLEELSRDTFYCDGILRLFSNSPIGDFAVVMCSDWLQLSTLQAWKSEAPLPELLFVVARNPYTELYLNFAKADAVRLYTGIVIANICDAADGVNCEGSGAVMPMRGDQEVVGQTVEPGEGLLKGVSIYELSLHAIRARSRGKPEPGYLAVPPAAKRT